MRRTGGFQMRRTAAGGLDTLHIVSIRDFWIPTTCERETCTWLYSKLYILNIQ